MKAMNAKEQLKYMKKFVDYLNTYGYEYTELAIEFLLESFLLPMSIESTPDILKQIYDELDMLLPEENCYLQFAQLVGETYGWNSHILEIGGGSFPSFSKHMDEFQQSRNSSGTITTYDPRLVVNKLGNIRLHKEFFSKEMTVESYDLIVGIMPCEATSMIIKKATKEHKEFFLAMCGCIHYEGLDVPRGIFGPKPITYDEYVEKIYNLAREQEKDGFEVIKEDAKQYSFKYPIIRSQKRR